MGGGGDVAGSPGFDTAPHAVRIACVLPFSAEAATFAVIELGRDQTRVMLTISQLSEMKGEQLGFRTGKGLNDVSLGRYTDGQVPRTRCPTLTRKTEMADEKPCGTAWFHGRVVGCGDPGTLTH